MILFLCLAYPAARFVTIDDNPGVQNNTLYGGSVLGPGGNTLSQYDYYTFTLSPRPAGTVMDIEIRTRNSPPDVNNYLFFNGIANPIGMFYLWGLYHIFTLTYSWLCFTN